MPNLYRPNWNTGTESTWSIRLNTNFDKEAAKSLKIESLNFPDTMTGEIEARETLEIINNHANKLRNQSLSNF